MGRLADEHLPEVVPGQQPPPQQQYYYQQQQQPQGLSPAETASSPLPQVVPDSSPEFAEQRFYNETDKIPAYYDTAPKLPYEQPIPTPSDQQQQQQQYQPGVFSAISPNSSVPWQSFPPGDDQHTYVNTEPEPEKRVCGLPKRRFIIIAVIIGLVIVAAAIGGGVGGSLAARRSSEEATETPAETTVPAGESTTDSPSITRPPTPTTTTESSTTSSAPQTSITFLHNQTNPAVFERVAFQGYEFANFTGRHTDILTKEDFHDLPFAAISYVWVPNDTGCCITFCASRTDSAGYRCDPIMKNSTDSGKGFPRIHIWCGGWTQAEEMKAKCS
ncbi:hypothetical protein VTJ49DRAFT_1601 [Mycothermus thermophilus]|uniref:Uncharacterized protein n=1 Tax=Humicola insolens TaxID=85995 RepID=A0ABR3VD88_HUMIN